jgi:hypothetical protein
MRKISTFILAGWLFTTPAFAQSAQSAATGSRTPAAPSNSPQAFGGYVPSPSAVIFSDDMDALNDTSSLALRGYFTYYRGTGPQGLTATWFQGNSAVFPDYNGVQPDGYVAANYNAVTGTNTIDSWLVLPNLNIDAGDTLSFYSQAPLNSTFPDSIRVMYNATGATLPEDPNWVELGRFKVNTLGIWERKFFIAPAAGANARFAIRYRVANGGPNGANSDYIGIDQIDVIEGGSGGGCPIAHDCCSDAADINSAFAGAVGTKITVGPYNNDNATTGIDDPVAGWSCFGEPDGSGSAPSLENTLWFTFVGTGDLYFVETDNCGTPPVSNYIDDGDTQAALYSGTCGSLTPVLCNEDGPQATASHYPVGFYIQTQAGVTYYLMIDGFNFNGALSNGNFCISVTKQQSLACGSSSLTPGTGSVNKNCVNYNDTLIASVTGAVIPTQGPYSGFSWLVSSADITGNNNPLNDPTFLGGSGISAVAQNVTLINSAIGNPFGPGIYYFTPVVYGNATDNPNPPNPPTNVFHLILDPNCTYTGTSMQVELKAQGQLCPVGINEIAAGNYSGINVYPVPVKDVAYFDINIKSGSEAGIMVKDNVGRVVYSEVQNISSGVNHMSIDMSSFTSGVYFITVRTNEGSFVSKFIKE